MSYEFESLKGLVKAGKLELTQIVALPRSLSTFFEISLAEAVGGNQINEPFHRTSFDDAMKQIHDRVLGLGIDEDGKKRLVIKDIARHIKDFDKLSEIVSNFIFLFRDPHIQMPSFVKRLAHTVDGKPGGDYLSTEQAFEKIQQVEDLLSKRNYEATSWKDFSNMLNYTLSNFRNSEKRVVILDGTLLKENPEFVTKEICGVIGFSYCSSMIEGSKLAGGKNFYYPNLPRGERLTDGRINSAWISDSVDATSYIRLKDNSYPLECYSPGLKDHMKETYGIYTNILSLEESIGPKSIASFRDYFPENSPGYIMDITKISPTVAFSHLVNIREKDKGNILVVDKILESLIKDENLFGTSFEVIDPLKRSLPRASVSVSDLISNISKKFMS